MSDILRQVDEDLRKEKLSNLWKRYGLYIISSVVIIIIAVAGFQLKTSIDKTKNQSLVEKYIKATNNKNINQQLLLFEEVLESNNDYLSGLAELKILNIRIENEKVEDSLLLLEKINKNEAYDAIIRDLATYFLLMRKLENPNYTGFTSILTKARIENSPFKYLFLEIKAIRKLVLGDLEEAKNEFNELFTNQDTPMDIRNRAIKFIELSEQNVK